MHGDGVAGSKVTSVIPHATCPPIIAHNTLKVEHGKSCIPFRGLCLKFSTEFLTISSNDIFHQI